MRPVTTNLARLGFETASARRRRRLAMFRQPFRLEVASLTLGWPLVEDLADSFPALLFALATGYGTAPARATAFRMVENGAPLKDVAAALDLPLWLRRVPADALLQPLPILPVDAEFTTQIHNRVPECNRECAVWLDRVLLAYRLVGREFALWAAREPRFLPPCTTEEDLQWLFAWAWASVETKAPGHALLRMAWNPAIGWKRARDEIVLWKKRIDLVGALADPARDQWFAKGQALGYDFVGLDTVADFLAESVQMENCLDQYAAHLSYGRVRVFSVRREGRPVADVELTLRADEITMPSISQVRGPRNRRASPHVWQAVHAWLGAQPFRALNAQPTPPAAAREAVKVFWAPYFRILQAAGLLPRLGGQLVAQEPRRTRARPRPDTIAAVNATAAATTPAPRVQAVLALRRLLGEAAEE